MGALVVLDTNVLISALGWNAKPEACLELVLEGRLEGAISPAILEERDRVMAYPRFAFTEDEKHAFVEIVVAAFHVVEPTVDLAVVDDDPDDDAVLACAVAADADYVVSGDAHLQDLGSFRGIDVVEPATLLARVDGDAEP